MKPRVSIITLATDDLSRALAFYRDGLGWETEGIALPEAGGDHIMFELDGSLALVLFERAGIEAVAGGWSAASSSEVILSLHAGSRDDADAILDAAVSAGGSAAGPRESAAWGFHGHFKDPDGHLWEVVWFAS